MSASASREARRPASGSAPAARPRRTDRPGRRGAALRRSPRAAGGRRDPPGAARRGATWSPTGSSTPRSPTRASPAASASSRCSTSTGFATGGLFPDRTVLLGWAAATRRVRRDAEPTGSRPRATASRAGRRGFEDLARRVSRPDRRGRRRGSPDDVLARVREAAAMTGLRRASAGSPRPSACWRRRWPTRHAYLLAGPPGSGKRLYAERFCAALLDAAPRPDRLRHAPRPVRARAGRQVILMEDARRLRRDLHMRPVRGGPPRLSDTGGAPAARRQSPTRSSSRSRSRPRTACSCWCRTTPTGCCRPSSPACSCAVPAVLDRRARPRPPATPPPPAPPWATWSGPSSWPGTRPRRSAAGPTWTSPAAR